MQLLERQCQPECSAAAATVAVLVDQSAAVRLDNQLTKRQADAAAANFGSLAELEQFGATFWRHSRAVIADVDDQLGVGLSGADANFAATGLRLDGVTQKIVKTLP
jgi:hypothetical protein